MPWEVHIYDITRDYYNRIFMDTQKDTSITDAFLSFIEEDSLHHYDALRTLEIIILRKMIVMRLL